MNVAELRAILDHVPDDLTVAIRSTHCSHVERVERRHTGRGHFSTFPDGTAWPPGLVLSGSTLWFEPEPPFELSGRFLDRRGLDAALDACGLGAEQPTARAVVRPESETPE